MDTGRVIRLDGKFDKGKIQVIKLWADRDRIGNPKLVKAMLQDFCLLYTSPSPRDAHESRMPSSA